jgi:hypothetical protein
MNKQDYKRMTESITSIVESFGGNVTLSDDHVVDAVFPDRVSFMTDLKSPTYLKRGFLLHWHGNRRLSPDVFGDTMNKIHFMKATTYAETEDELMEKMRFLCEKVQNGEAFQFPQLVKN